MIVYLVSDFLITNDEREFEACPLNKNRILAFNQQGGTDRHLLWRPAIESLLCRSDFLVPSEEGKMLLSWNKKQKSSPPDSFPEGCSL